MKYLGCVRNFIILVFKWRRVIKKYGWFENKFIIEEERMECLCVWYVCACVYACMLGGGERIIINVVLLDFLLY